MFVLPTLFDTSLQIFFFCLWVFVGVCGVAGVTLLTSVIILLFANAPLLVGSLRVRWSSEKLSDNLTAHWFELWCLFLHYVFPLTNHERIQFLTIKREIEGFQFMITIKREQKRKVILFLLFFCRSSPLALRKCSLLRRLTSYVLSFSVQSSFSIEIFRLLICVYV